MIVRDHLIKRRNLLHRRARIEPLACDWFACCIDARNEKQVIDDSGKPFAFTDRGFDDFAIVGRSAIARQSDLRFT